MLTKWNNKTNTVKVKDILIFLFWYFARIVTFLLFFHDYCMIMLYFDLLLFFLICYCYNLPFIFPQEYKCKINYIFFIIIITVPDWVQMLTYQCLCLHCTRALIDKHWLYVVKYRKRVIHKTSWLPNSLLLYIH